MRPSIKTSSLLDVVLLKPRAEMAHCRESICATSRFSARRSASGRLDAPDRRMSSSVMTWIAEPVWERGSARLETEVTSRFKSCSKLSFLSVLGDVTGKAVWAWAWLAAAIAKAVTDAKACRAKLRQGRGHGDLAGAGVF